MSRQIKISKKQLVPSLPAGQSPTCSTFVPMVPFPNKMQYTVISFLNLHSIFHSIFEVMMMFRKISVLRKIQGCLTNPDAGNSDDLGNSDDFLGKSLKIFCHILYFFAIFDCLNRILGKSDD